MKALIGFDRYSISCVIGVNPEERVSEQEILVDLRVGHEIGACVVDDTVEKTICYVKLADLCENLAQRGRYKLLETLAASIVQTIHEQFGKRSVWLCIRKPNALPKAEATVVEVRWEGP